MNKGLKFVVRTLNVPKSLPHKSRAEEIADLPRFLEVQSLLAPELVLVNMGEQEPGPDRAEFPWIKLNSNGEPLGLMVNVGGEWKDAFSKLVIKDSVEGVAIERGETTVVMAAWTLETPKTYDKVIPFNKSFKTAPDVYVQMISDTFFSAALAYTTMMIPTDITTDGFKVLYATKIATASSPQSVRIRWMAIGKRDD